MCNVLSNSLNFNYLFEVQAGGCTGTKWWNGVVRGKVISGVHAPEFQESEKENVLPKMTQL